MKKYEWQGQPVWLDLREVVGIQVAVAGYSGEVLGSDVSLRGGKVLWVSVGAEELAAEIDDFWGVGEFAEDELILGNPHMGLRTRAHACDAGVVVVAQHLLLGSCWADDQSVCLDADEEAALLGWLLARRGEKL